MNFADETAYRDYYRTICHGDTRHLTDPDGYERPRVLWLISEAARHGGGLLDVGCGSGEATAELARLFPSRTVAGLDPGERHIAEARRRHPEVPFYCGFAEDLAHVCRRLFAGVPLWRTVLCGDVLEHVPDPAAFLHTLKQLGRHVCLTTPLGVWEGSVEHLHVWDEDSIRSLVAPFRGSYMILPDRDGRPRWFGIRL